MIRAVGFDLDDTLLDHRGAAILGITKLLQEHDWTYEGATDLGLEWKRVERICFANRVVGELTLIGRRRERMRAFIGKLGIKVDDSALDELSGEYLSHYANSWAAFPDAQLTLETLRDQGFRLAILTNGHQLQQEAKLAKLGFLDMFHSILTTDSLLAPKPDVRAFMQLSSTLGCEPAEIIYIGDDPHLDAIAACKAGLFGVWLNRTDQELPDGVTTQIRTLKSINPIIDERNRIS